MSKRKKFHRYEVIEKSLTGIRTRIVDAVQEGRDAYNRYWRLHTEAGEEMPPMPTDAELLEMQLQSWADDEDVLSFTPVK